MARLEDICTLSRTRQIPKFTHFLNERQILITQQYLAQTDDEGCVFWGGWPDSMRQVLGVFPFQPDRTAFPITAVNVLHRAGDRLSHRDFLGSLMGLGIKRESVGDILPQEDRCVLFVLEPVAATILGELKKVGSIGVRCEAGDGGRIIVTQDFKELRGTVSSLRLDSLVSLLTGLAREKSAGLIKSELVQRNYSVVQNGAREFAAGDKITIRGYGKFIVDEIGNPTKKGRLPIFCRKYN